MEIAEVSSETASLVDKNGKEVQDIKVGDAKDTAADSDEEVVVTTVRIVKKSKQAIQDEAAVEGEEIVEVKVEGDEDGETVKITETKQVDNDDAADKDSSETTTVTTVKTINQVAKPETNATNRIVAKNNTVNVDDAAALEDSSAVDKEKETLTSEATITKTMEAKEQTKNVTTKEEVKVEDAYSTEEEQEEEDDVEEEDEGQGQALAATVKITNAASKPTQAPSAPSQASDSGIATVPAQATESSNIVQQQKQDNLNNTLKEIISDIDRDIEQQEDISKLKATQLELLKQQQALTQQIRQQQLLAQQLAEQNQQQVQQLQQQKLQQNQHRPQTNQISQSGGQISKSTTFEESQTENGYSRTNKSYELEESSSNITKRIDLQKIFTPATDAEEILPKNRKLYASSAFYAHGLHPTVEDQVELARRISHSLSDISNQQSKGQSMFVNRKKRSVKWVHEGSGKGAELFAKRRRKADKWVIDETNAGTQSPSGLPDNHQYQPKPASSPSLIPAYSDAGKHRVQINMQQEQLIEKYAKPGLKVVKTPWEAALESGSASTAFVEEHKLSSLSYTNQSLSPTISPAPAPQYIEQHRSASPYSGGIPGNDYVLAQQKLTEAKHLQPKPSSYNSQRDLAYKPNIAQGWKAPCVTLPKELGCDLLIQGTPLEVVQLQQQQCDYHHQEEGQELQQTYAKLSKNNEAQSNKSDQELFSNCMEYMEEQEHRELHQNTKLTKTTTTSNKNNSLVDDKRQQHRTVDVAKQLQHFEEYQQYVAMQQQQEEYLLQLRLQRQRNQQEKHICQKNIGLQGQETQLQKMQQKREKIDEAEQEQYVQIAVRDLISTFEQQSLAEAEEISKQQQMLLQWKGRQQHHQQQQQQKQQIQMQQLPKSTRQITFEEYQRNKEQQWHLSSNGKLSNNDSEEYQQELYVPKEIPLESYAPPPTATSNHYSKPSHSWSPAQPTSSSEQYSPTTFTGYHPTLHKEQVPPKSFPLSQPASPSNFGNYGGLTTSTYAPPKQQILPPTSYQTVPQTSSQAPPQVNFNPSPLPYDKLAKFENPSPPECGSPIGGTSYSPYRPLGVPGSRVRNISPEALSMAAPAVLSPQTSLGGGATSPHYGTPGSSRPPSQQYGSYGGLGGSIAPPMNRAVDLTHCQNFNNAARGWGAGQRSSFGGGHVGYRNTKPMASTGSMPYTDF